MKKKLLTVFAISLFSLSLFGTTFAAKSTNAPVIVIDGVCAWAG
ncbi:hypothetical protein BH24DEI2_BH24DEI2_09520 [soil metagenome]